MRSIDARLLLTMPTERLWDILTGPFELVFDDGPLEVTARETIYSSYAWEFHRLYPKTPLLKRHHVRTVLGERRLGSKTHTDLLGRVMFDVWDCYEKDGTVSLDTLAKLTYEVTNTIYNELTYRCEEYVTSLDITDFIKVLDHPVIAEARRNVKPTQASIDEVHDLITSELRTSPELINNPLALAVQSDLANIGQVLQCVGFRAFLTDIDSNLFPKPIMRGYAEGIRLFHDSLIESRSAAKSLIFATVPLETAEYFSRRLQLMCETVQNLHPGDCGSTEYLYWPLEPAEFEDGKMVKRPDLDLMLGKHYVDDDGQLRTLTKTDTHLYGRTLKLRSVLHCSHRDAYGVCATCFGELALSVPENSNIGQVCSSAMAQQSTQNVLSVKHFDGSSSVELIVLNEYEKMFLRTTDDRTGYMLAAELEDKDVKIEIGKQFATNFTDIMEVSDVEELNITQISEIPEIAVYVDTPQGIQTGVIDVSLNRRLASMTYPLLEHIHQVGWTINEKDNYIIDMTEWDYTRPLLQLPMKHFNMSDHSEQIAEILESSMKELEVRADTSKVDPTMEKLFKHVNSKLNVNFAILEVILFAAMVVDPENEDYSLPKTFTERRLGVLDSTIANRSMSAKMAYEDQKLAILDPRSYVETNRLDHPMDAIICPVEVLGDD